MMAEPEIARLMGSSRMNLTCGIDHQIHGIMTREFEAGNFTIRNVCRVHSSKMYSQSSM